MAMEAELAGLSPDRDMLLTIGVFDSVHLGHKHLLSQLKELARKQGLASGVVTFRQNPQEILSHRKKLPFLTSITQRINLLKNEGIDAIIPLSFTAELARLSARSFLELLQKHLRMRGVVIGPDFALGRNREGNTETMRRLGEEMGFSVSIVPPLIIDGEVVSSTAIRKALAKGDMKRVQKLTGRPFRLQGRVVPGAGRGVKLGFPTANLDIEAEQALPPDGVYVSQANINKKGYFSLTNIGRRPTFGRGERLVEVLLLDGDRDLYGQELEIDILERLRGEKKFNTAEELRKQIARDVERGKKWLSSLTTSIIC
jgi:riboflavin kinase/FMN adenylyltransferase